MYALPELDPSQAEPSEARPVCPSLFYNLIEDKMESNVQR